MGSEPEWLPGMTSAKKIILTLKADYAMHDNMTYDEYIDMLYNERLNYEHTELLRITIDNNNESKNKTHE